MARAIAVLRPTRVTSLTLVGPSFPLDDPPEAAAQPFERWAAARSARDMEAALSVARAHWIRGDAQEARLRELLVRQRTDLPDAAPFPEAAQEVERIAAPTLVVVGAADTPLVVLGSDVLAHRIPGAQLKILAGARHHPQEDQPLAFARLVLDFLATLETTTP